MKLTEARTNTHGAEINGVVFSGAGLKPQRVFVRFTSDDRGETLSFEAGGRMIAVPFEPVEALIKETRRSRGKD